MQKTVDYGEEPLNLDNYSPHSVAGAPLTQKILACNELDFRRPYQAVLPTAAGAPAPL